MNRVENWVKKLKQMEEWKGIVRPEHERVLDRLRKLREKV
jgi:hypothetical protein